MNNFRLWYKKIHGVQKYLFTKCTFYHNPKRTIALNHMITNRLSTHSTNNKHNDILIKLVEIVSPFMIASTIIAAGFYFKDDSNKLHLTAVKQNGLALKYIDNQTDKICMAAVKQNACALKYVKNQTEKMCLAAVKQKPYMLPYVKNQTDKICLAAVKNGGYMLKDVENQTYIICLAAVKNDGTALKYVKDINIKSALDEYKYQFDMPFP